MYTFLGNNNDGKKFKSLDDHLLDGCTTGNLLQVRMLVNEGGNVLARDERGNTVFHLCCNSRAPGCDSPYMMTTTL